MKFLFLLLIPGLTIAAPQKDISEARESIKALISPLVQRTLKKLPAGLEDFEVKGCDKHNINWREFLTFQSGFTLTYKFKEGCDIQGSVTPKLLQPFPASLEVRNLMDFKKVDTMNKITSTIESRPTLFLEMREGKLLGKKGKVVFEADYSVKVNPLKREDPIEENLGGEIRISEIYGQKVSIKEKIMIK